MPRAHYLSAISTNNSEFLISSIGIITTVSCLNQENDCHDAIPYNQKERN